MGGSSSTPRTVTVDPEEGNTVVTVSEAVARRLLGKPDNPTTDTTRVTDDKTLQPKKPITSSQIPSAKEDKLNLLEAYRDRIDVLQKHADGLEELSRKKFNEAVTEVEGKFIKPATTAPVCVDLQNAVLHCYLDNPTATLNCAPIVREFKECVEQQRQALQSQKG